MDDPQRRLLAGLKHVYLVSIDKIKSAGAVVVQEDLSVLLSRGFRPDDIFWLRTNVYVIATRQIWPNVEGQHEQYVQRIQKYTARARRYIEQYEANNGKLLEFSSKSFFGM